MPPDGVALLEYHELVDIVRVIARLPSSGRAAGGSLAALMLVPAGPAPIIAASRTSGGGDDDDDVVVLDLVSYSSSRSDVAWHAREYDTGELCMKDFFMSLRSTGVYVGINTSFQCDACRLEHDWSSHNLHTIGVQTDKVDGSVGWKRR